MRPIDAHVPIRIMVSAAKILTTYSVGGAEVSSKMGEFLGNLEIGAEEASRGVTLTLPAIIRAISTALLHTDLRLKSAALMAELQPA